MFPAEILSGKSRAEHKSMAEFSYLLFKCPQCSCSVCEEVLVQVTQSTTFSRLTCEGEIAEPEYQNSATEGGEIERYQCQACGFVLKNESGETINNVEGLQQWFERFKVAT